MIRLRGISLGLDEPIEALRYKVSAALGCQDFIYDIERESLDARRRGGRQEIRFQYVIKVYLPSAVLEERMAQRLHLELVKEVDQSVVSGTAPWSPGERPIVVGFGPAGLFAAYLLAREGYRPLIFERGEPIEERRKTVEAFWSGKATLNTESNVQFGEGGAGTFSDGKLTSRSKDIMGVDVLRIFCDFGAPEEITYSALPHIGTDLLTEVITTMRKQIIAWGAEVHFNSKVEALGFRPNGSLDGVVVKGQTFRGPVLMGVGHSARDTFRMLISSGVSCESKDFAVGLRIEHPQHLIDLAQYGNAAGHPRLGAASYALHSRMNSEGRNAYSFCMCPGGFVVAAASLESALVVNGMSNYAREGHNANSAILTSARSGRDFGEELWDGVAFQDALERKAFRLGGCNYHAPVQTVTDFLGRLGFDGPGESRTDGDIEPSYRPGIHETNLTDLLPQKMAKTIAEGLWEMNQKIEGFAGAKAILTAVESRSSSPLRFVRDKLSRESLSTPNLYPIGEGAGYAGGIVSSAIDGLRSAQCIIKRYRRLV